MHTCIYRKKTAIVLKIIESHNMKKKWQEVEKVGTSFLNIDVVVKINLFLLLVVNIAKNMMFTELKSRVLRQVTFLTLLNV